MFSVTKDADGTLKRRDAAGPDGQCFNNTAKDILGDDADRLMATTAREDPHFAQKLADQNQQGFDASDIVGGRGGKGKGKGWTGTGMTEVEHLKRRYKTEYAHEDNGNWLDEPGRLQDCASCGETSHLGTDPTFMSRAQMHASADMQKTNRTFAPGETVCS
mgnify:CR=1 FL=1